MQTVFKDLLGEEGSEIYLKPASWYVRVGLEVDMLTTSAAVASFNEVFIGYRTSSNGCDNKVVLNPPKASVQTFTDSDMLIVLAEN